MASACGDVDARTARAKRVMIRASSRSVLASRPTARAASRIQGATGGRVSKDASPDPGPYSAYNRTALSHRIFRLLVSLSGSPMKRSIAFGYFESPCG